MDAQDLMSLGLTLLWCHVAVLAVAWARAVAAEDRRTHVVRAVDLTGHFVPLAGGLVLIPLAAGLAGFGAPGIALAVILPAGLALAFAVELRAIEGPRRGAAERRLLWTVALAAGAVLARSA